MLLPLLKRVGAAGLRCQDLKPLRESSLKNTAQCSKSLIAE